MKKAITTLVSMLFVFAIVSAAFASDWIEAEEVAGEVTAVDVKAKTITLKGKKGAITLACDLEETTLAKVKAGDKVTVVCAHEGGKQVIKAIKKDAPAKKKEPAKK